MNNLAEINFDDYDENALDIISTKLTNARIGKLEKRITKLENDRLKDKEHTSIEIEEAKEEARKAFEVGRARAKIEDGYDGYVNQTILGEKFQLKISSNQVGLLLKMSGIAMKSYSSTKPYDDKVPKYAKIKYYPDCYGRDQESYVWNQANCIIKIEDWLEKHNKLKAFYACETNGKLEKYIKSLYQDFKNGLFDED